MIQLQNQNQVFKHGGKGTLAAAPLPPPDAPTMLDVVTCSPTDIGIEWIDNSDDETGFEIWRSVDGGAFALLITLAANSFEYTDNDTPAGSTYTYKVRAVRGVDVSDFSNEETCDLVAPDAPSNLAVTDFFEDCENFAATFTLTWDDNSDDELGFEIYQDVGGTGYELLTTVGPNVTSYDVVFPNGTWGGICYDYKVLAFKTIQSDFSNSDQICGACG